MGYLIDSDLWIAIERGHLSAADIHAITRQASIYLSPVNLAEIRFGIEMMTDAKQKQRAMAMLRRMRRKPLLRIGAETAEIFGALAARLARSGRGQEFRVQDLWLAAQAVERKFTLLTGNAKDFRDVPGLKFVAMSAHRSGA
jgi:predicted nucleic acid-binding protein